MSLDAFLSASDAATRAAAFVSLVHAARPGAGGTWKGSGLAALLDAVEAPGEPRERFGASLAALLAETDATNLVACAGIPGHRGFVSEFGDRLASHLLPSPGNERDIRQLAHRLYRSEHDVQAFGGIPLDLFHRVAGAFGHAPPPGSWDGLRAAFADGFRLLLSRVETEGLSPKLRARASSRPVSASPFHRIRAAGESMLAAWLEGVDPADSATRFRKVSGECRKEARLIEQHLEGAGVSIDIVFSLEVIERCLTRTALMTEIIETPAGPRRSRAVHRLLFRLFRSAGEDREDRIAATVAQLTSSQLAAAVGNVTVVAAGAALFSWAFVTLAGRPFLAEADALETLRVMSPINSWTIWYAALTGVVLWLASVAGGWFDNWCVYHRLPDGIAQLSARPGRGRSVLGWLSGALSRHASGWGTNISLGFMLGMMPEIGRFTGLPVDVRHVTLNTGIVSLAAASGAETGANNLTWLIRAIAGVGVMFVLNLSVSFACSLLSAARAYELPAEDLGGILREIGRRLLRSPLEFLCSPRPVE
jgi:site-specific recombinase